jgi:hypothetical protein
MQVMTTSQQGDAGIVQLVRSTTLQRSKKNWIIICFDALGAVTAAVGGYGDDLGACSQLAAAADVTRVIWR